VLAPVHVYLSGARHAEQLPVAAKTLMFAAELISSTSRLAIRAKFRCAASSK
jgi:hypothetical protein